ncbi:flagellar hook-associated protein FlgK [Shewanella sp. A25]|nr:flagellar hook-associated protein FlgK [Shewanella shenzhenensis]
MSSLLSNALSGLNAANVGLTVSGNNVANSATDGYSRQGVQFGTVVSGGQNGVYVTNVDRIVNGFFNDDIWRTQSDLSFYSNLQTYLGYTEELAGTDSLNFNDAVGSLTSALNSCLSQPESNAYRQEVLSAAQALVSKMSQMNSSLQDQNSKLEKEIGQTAVSINSTLRQLADYNEKVALATAKGEPTAELLDAREKLTTQLASFVSIKTTNNSDGTISISTPTGAPLLMGSTAAELSLGDNGVNLAFGKQNFGLSEAVGGALGGLLAVKENVLQPTMDSFSSILSQLADDVNAALGQGFDLNGDAGIPLFTYDANDPFGTFAVNPDMTTEKLAFIGGYSDANGDWVAAGGVGDNSNLQGIINAFNSQSTEYSLLMGRLGSMSAENQSSVTTSQSLNDNAVAARDSLSGVNLDEEASNILYYQQMYQANAKVISVANETFQTLLTMF